MSFVLFNNEFIKKEDLSFYDVERFRVADACFESMLWNNGSIPLLTGHQTRLDSACTLFDFQSYNISLSAINGLVKTNKISSNYARVRLSLIRRNGRNYQSVGQETNVLIEADPLDEIFQAVESLGTYPNWKKPASPFGAFKHSNALIYVMARQYAQKHNYDEVVLLNQDDEIIEASSSNVFFIKDEKIYSPGIESGGVRGVCQEYIVNFFDVKEVNLSESKLMEADEIFLSNAVQVMRPVKNYLNRRLSTSFTESLIDRIKLRLAV